MEYVKLCAPNDVNGNPRRFWLALEAGNVLAVINEGYLGDEALALWAGAKHCRVCGRRFTTLSGDVLGCSVHGIVGSRRRLPGPHDYISVCIGAKEYRDWKRDAKSQGMWVSS